MRRTLISLAAAGTMVVGSGFLMAAHATTPPPPTYSSPCGHSTETGPAPGSPQLVGIPPDPNNLGGAGTIGIIGPDGYLEAAGTAGPGGVSGTISGATAPSHPPVYGSLSNASGSPAICVGGGPVPTTHIP